MDRVTIAKIWQRFFTDPPAIQPTAARALLGLVSVEKCIRAVERRFRVTLFFIGIFTVVCEVGLQVSEDTVLTRQLEVFTRPSITNDKQSLHWTEISANSINMWNVLNTVCNAVDWERDSGYLFHRVVSVCVCVRVFIRSRKNKKTGH